MEPQEERVGPIEEENEEVHEQENEYSGELDGSWEAQQCE